MQKKKQNPMRIQTTGISEQGQFFGGSRCKPLVHTEMGYGPCTIMSDPFEDQQEQKSTGERWFRFKNDWLLDCLNKMSLYLLSQVVGEQQLLDLGGDGLSVQLAGQGRHLVEMIGGGRERGRPAQR
jgi:hypothetical protein